MTGIGRLRTFRTLMLVGNKNGMCGYNLSRVKHGVGSKTYLKAMNKAGLRMMYFDRYEDRTVYHDFFTNFGNTTLFVQQKPVNHGVEAHRVIKAICELVGIKDIKVTNEGSRNPVNQVKAFMLGLLRQRTHQELANEMKLHLVEFREENDNFPKVVASPEDGVIRTEDQIGKDEILDFEMVMVVSYNFASFRFYFDLIY